MRHVKHLRVLTIATLGLAPALCFATAGAKRLEIRVAEHNSSPSVLVVQPVLVDARRMFEIRYKAGSRLLAKKTISESLYDTLIEGAQGDLQTLRRSTETRADDCDAVKVELTDPDATKRFKGSYCDVRHGGTHDEQAAARQILRRFVRLTVKTGAVK